MARYVSTAPVAITPSTTGPIAPGGVVDLDEAAAAPFIESGLLVAAADQPAVPPKPAAEPSISAPIAPAPADAGQPKETSK